MSSGFISYAQNGEDVVLWRALGQIDNGFYIDVGAYDAEEDSVTKAFYNRGWRGINIEPVIEWFNRLNADRPRDININAVLGETPGTRQFYEVPRTGLSTLVSELASQHERDGMEVRATTARVLTLAQVCEDVAPGEVHFLKIDAEGSEGEVILGGDFTRFRPWVVAVEATKPGSNERTDHEWRHALETNGYRFILFDGLNCYFIANEHPELEAALSAPANIHDGYRRAVDVRREAAIAAERHALAEDRRHAEHQARIAEGLLAAEREAGLAAEELLAAEREARLAAEELLAAEREARLAAEELVAMGGRARAAARDLIVTEHRARLTAEMQLAAERQARGATEAQLLAERQAQNATEKRLAQGRRTIKNLKRRLSRSAGKIRLVLAYRRQINRLQRELHANSASAHTFLPFLQRLWRKPNATADLESRAIDERRRDAESRRREIRGSRARPARLRARAIRVPPSPHASSTVAVAESQTGPGHPLKHMLLTTLRDQIAGGRQGVS